MNLKDKTCCFSGHRNLGKYDYNYVYQRTKDIITLLAENGIVYFGTGGAIGFDTIAAKAVFAVREIYPQIKLILVLPCEDQARYWKTENVEEYNKIKEQADKIRYVSKSYYDGCIHKKNRHMVDCSSICVCFLTDFESGTAVTVDYAIEKGLDVINVADEFDDVL